MADFKDMMNKTKSKLIEASSKTGDSFAEFKGQVAPVVERTTKSIKEQSIVVTGNIGNKIKNVSSTIKKNKEDSDAENLSSENAEMIEEAIDSEKKISLDDQLRKAIDEYNATYTLMSDKGTRLYIQRERSIDLVKNIEKLINSIANHPKEFDKEISEIIVLREEFTNTCEFAREELEAAQKSAMSAGAGVAGGVAVASLAPSAAMWIATTFGTASTGTAISALSGAAAQNAALAWLGGGALTAGGGGMVGGQAFLALAGPVGWSIVGATLLASVVLFANQKIKIGKQKKEEIESVLINTENLREVDGQIKLILDKTSALRVGADEMYSKCLEFYNKDYTSISDVGRMQLGTLVNETKVIASMLSKGVE